MGKYFAVFVVQFIILALCVANLQSEEISEKKVEEFQKELDNYSKLIEINEDELKKMEWELDLEINSFSAAKTNINNQFTDLQNQLTECQQQSNNQTKQHTINTELIRNFITKFSQLIDDKANETQTLQSNIAEADLKLRERDSEISNLKNAQRELQAKQHTLEEKIRELNKIIHINENQFRNCQAQLKPEIPTMESKLRREENNTHLPTTKIQLNVPNSCISSNGVQFIQVADSYPIYVLCDKNVLGPGWMIIQRRIDGKLAFNRNWADYKKGFGGFHKEFFLGLRKLHLITNAQQHELYIRLTNFNNRTYFAHYADFKIGTEQNGYPLEVLGNFKGNASDAMTENRLQTFKTYDRGSPYQNNCPNKYSGGWWFPSSSCGNSNLNGQYDSWNQNKIFWGNSPPYSIKTVYMMIRPKQARK
ncbi:uncharacterized protein Dvir_GJ26780 [Drosophila virilis]|uniref:Fibrinogen C-terminal domain-containing protein n=1 Tax=Drosophila virilis TaxID=7244 RepID=A0A0Q9WLR8_DROVI|nr:fibrinogen-like protein 1 [Drosophila virilis]KRF81328.1 uncharacterized protein Dvir_GJ26780 [Drosophila virilis]